MSEMRPEGEENAPVRREKPQVGVWGIVLVLACMAVAAGIAIDASLQMRSANANLDAAQTATVHAMGLVEPKEKSLDPKFIDSQGRLLADPPASQDELMDPQTIVVAHLDSTDPETPGVSWEQFDAHLAEVTGRKVVDEPFDNGPDQLADIASGKITLVAMHAADSPFLVNHFGYQPVAVLGNDNGANGNHLDIIVPANSSIAQPADLRGHTLVCAVPSSITGYRAAVTLLDENQGLRPNVDYVIIWSLGQKKSIEGIAKGEYEAAAISDDKLQSLLANGDVKPSDYHTIYQSEVIPRTTIGWFYNLQPELAAKVKDAILTFEPKEAADDTSGGKPLHFIPCDYKKDFAVVREIDDRFDPRLDSKTKKAAAPATEPAPDTTTVQ